MGVSTARLPSRAEPLAKPSTTTAIKSPRNRDHNRPECLPDPQVRQRCESDPRKSRRRPADPQAAAVLVDVERRRAAVVRVHEGLDELLGHGVLLELLVVLRRDLACETGEARESRAKKRILGRRDAGLPRGRRSRSASRRRPRGRRPRPPPWCHRRRLPCRERGLAGLAHRGTQAARRARRCGTGRQHLEGAL